MKLTIKQISQETGIPISVIEYTIATKGLKVLYNEEGKRVTDKELLLQAREKIKRGRPALKRKEFDFDFAELQKVIFAKGLRMKDFFEFGISRNRYYSIKSGVVIPTKKEIEILIYNLNH